MRNDHVFEHRLGDALPSQAEIERSMAHARRMRSAVIHRLLARALARIADALRVARSPKALQGC